MVTQFYHVLRVYGFTKVFFGRSCGLADMIEASSSILSAISS